MINPKDIERLLEDSRASTLTETDELCFIRLVLKCLSSGIPYSEALRYCHAQLNDIISGE